MDNQVNGSRWIRCPICGSKTRTKVYDDTVLIKFPLYCPKCKKEMAPEHFIEWVYVQTERGGQRKTLKPGDDPNVTFSLGDDKAVAVYAYCNLHGLWMTEV